MSTASQGSTDRSARQAKIQAAAPKQSKLKPILGAVIAVAAIAGIGAAIVFGMRSNDTGAAGALPKGAISETGGIMLNAKDPGSSVPTLDIYEDFQCPYCAHYHKALGSTVNELASSGKAKVVFHMKTFLDQGIPGDKSMKAANAASCAANVSPQAFGKVHDSILESQPEHEGEGWADMTFANIATKAGITGDAKKTFDKCVADSTYSTYLKKVDEQSSKDGVKGTPTYRVNGKEIDLQSMLDPQTRMPSPQVAPSVLTKAVEDATKK